MASHIISCLTSGNYQAARDYITRPQNTMVTIKDLEKEDYDDDTYMIAEILKAKKASWRRFPKVGDRSKAQKTDAPYDRMFMLR